MTARQRAGSQPSGWFSETAADGRLVELRLPHSGEMPCVLCTFDGDDSQPHRCEDNVYAPHWFLPCAAHLRLETGCPDCSTVPAADAVDALPVAARGRALSAHLAAAAAIQQHLRAAQAVDDDIMPPAGAALCAACVTDSSAHATLLEGEMLRFAADLFDIAADTPMRIQLACEPSVETRPM